jgi:intracellular multiplication protein IcmJ
MAFAPISFDVQRKSASAQSVQAYHRQAVNFEDLLTPEQKLKILERDKYSCQCCGFRSEKYQKIHAKNGNQNDHASDNLMTLCVFCHQCFHLDAVATMKSGVLIWLPEVSQAVLNNVARALYVARISQGDVATQAKKIIDSLMARREEAKARLGTDDPAVMASILTDYLEERHYAERMKKLQGVRLMPLDRRIIKEGDYEFNQYPQINAYWRSKDGAFGELMPNKWLNRYKELFHSVKAA